MEQYISANVTTNLYWFGRHIERVEVLLHEIICAYDKIIDIDKNAGVELYKKIGVDLIYLNAMDFFQKAVFGNHSANLDTLMEYARENAIISRNYINAEAFGEIIELRAMFKDMAKDDAHHIDYKFIDKAQSLISEIWGQLSKTKFKKNSDYFIRLGKLVEEADFHFRFGSQKHLAMNVIDEIFATIKIIGSDEMSQFQYQSDQIHGEEVMDIIHSKIEELMVF